MTSLLAFHPPILLKAKRSSGFVDIPDYHRSVTENWNGAISTPDIRDHPSSDFAGSDDADGISAGPTHLQRTMTMGGNIVVFEPDSESPQAFWLQRKIGQSPHGVIRIAYKLRQNVDADLNGSSNAWQLDVNDQGLTSLVKITIMHNTVLHIPTDSQERQSPLNEMTALQMIAKLCSPEVGHVVGTRLVGTCTSHVYTVVPYYPDGTLLQYCVAKGNLAEPVARYLFRQILQVRGGFFLVQSICRFQKSRIPLTSYLLLGQSKGLNTLRAVGLCHRNLSLDAIELDGDLAVISGLDRCLRFDRSVLVDANEASLIPGASNPQFVAPEYFGRLSGTWDGFAADVWATGLMLYSMVVGTEALFSAPVGEDKTFVALCVNGMIRESVDKFAKSVQRKILLSDELVCLLKKMLQADPRKRCGLNEVLEHPWVVNGDVLAPSAWEVEKIRDSTPSNSLPDNI